MVQRSCELLNWSRSVSWLTATADQILQWTWKKKTSRIGGSFQSSLKTRSTLHKFIWFLHLPTKTAQRCTSKVYRCREICWKPTTVFDLLQVSVKLLGYQFEESARDRTGNAIAESIQRFWWKIQATAGGKRRKKIRTETWVKLSIKPEEIDFNQSIIFWCPLFSRSELKYLSSIAKPELTYPPPPLHFG